MNSEICNTQAHYNYTLQEILYLLIFFFWKISKLKRKKFRLQKVFVLSLREALFLN